MCLKQRQKHHKRDADDKDYYACSRPANPYEMVALEANLGHIGDHVSDVADRNTLECGEKFRAEAWVDEEQRGNDCFHRARSR